MGMDEGTHLGTCLVYAPCVMAFVACENADKFFIYVLHLLKLAVHGHGRGKRLGSCLVLQSHASCVVSLQHVPMFQCVGCERLKMVAVHGHG